MLAPTISRKAGRRVCRGAIAPGNRPFLIRCAEHHAAPYKKDRIWLLRNAREFAQ